MMKREYVQKGFNIRVENQSLYLSALVVFRRVESRGREGG